jgi:hypothetical protein
MTSQTNLELNGINFKSPKTSRTKEKFRKFSFYDYSNIGKNVRLY